MGSCICKERKSREAYIREIFDGLDIDGTQTLDGSEIKPVWNKAKQHKLEELQKELEKYTQEKTCEIESTKKLTAESMLKDGNPMKLKEFMTIFNSLNMSKDELKAFWINTKKSEIKALQDMVNAEVN